MRSDTPPKGSRIRIVECRGIKHEAGVIGTVTRVYDDASFLMWQDGSRYAEPYSTVLDDLRWEFVPDYHTIRSW